jgi:hypothetical protein
VELQSLDFYDFLELVIDILGVILALPSTILAIQFLKAHII